MADAGAPMQDALESLLAKKKVELVSVKATGRPTDMIVRTDGHDRAHRRT